MRIVIAGLFALFLCPALVAQGATSETMRTERLVGLGKLWGSIRTLHPDLATKPIDWDKALVDAIRKIDSTQSKGDFVDAVQTMLAILEDSSTCLARASQSSQLELPREMKPFEWLADGTLFIHLNEVSRFTNTGKETESYIRSLQEELAKASRVIVDIRADKGTNGLSKSERSLEDESLQMVFESMVPRLINRPLALPAKRLRAHLGYRGDIDTGYTTGILLQAGKVLKPIGEGLRKELAFLVNDQTLLPIEVMALRQAGLALLVTEGDPGRDWAAETSPFILPEGITGRKKIADFEFEDGSNSCIADGKVLPNPSIGGDMPGVRLIREQWANPDAKAKLHSTNPHHLPTFLADQPYPDMQLPDPAYRVMAAIKFWTVIDTFYPFKHLLDHPWSETLGGFISAMDRVKTMQDYHLAVAAMMARIQDSHGVIRMAIGGFLDPAQEPPGIRSYLGTGAIPVALAMVEGRPVVVRTWFGAQAQAGFKLGDEILAVDGEDAAARIDRIKPYLSASTPQRLDFRAANLILRGTLGQEGTVRIRRVDGTNEILRVMWSSDGPIYKGRWRTGPEYRMMEGNIGYVDLDRLSPAQIQPMLTELEGSKAVILDMRGYPSAGGGKAVGRFLKHAGSPFSIQEIPLVLGEPEDGNPLRTSADCPYDGPKYAPYPGKVIMLMDERSQSWAEDVGLQLEAAADATFIGSATSGADGDVTCVVLPGALRVFFTGRSIRHSDGRQFQRVGLQPNVNIRPTIKGLAEGRDEVLERAVRFVEEGR